MGRQGEEGGTNGVRVLPLRSPKRRRHEGYRQIKIPGSNNPKAKRKINLHFDSPPIEAHRTLPCPSWIPIGLLCPTADPRSPGKANPSAVRASPAARRILGPNHVWFGLFASGTDNFLAAFCPLSVWVRSAPSGLMFVALATSWEPQEEGMMSTSVSFPSARNQGLIDQ
jgi:hypothetical protein